MIISSALVFVWYLQTKQTKPAQDLTIDMAGTRIENKEFKEAAFKQSGVEFTDAAGHKFVTTIGSDATREMLLKKVDEFNKANPSTAIKIGCPATLAIHLWKCAVCPDSSDHENLSLIHI